MNKKKLVLFAYNFEHKKTQDIILRLFLEGVKINFILANDWIKLKIPPSSIRAKIKHIGLVHPQKIAERIGVPYYVLHHNSFEAKQLIESEGIDIGIIAGARILKKPIIDAFNIGIINLHPGLLPEARGLDAMLWSIYKDLPLGVTAHLIDENIDAGRLLIKEKIKLQKEDTILDISERLYEKQLEILVPAICAASESVGAPIDPSLHYNRKMDAEKERIVLNKLQDYIREYHTK